MDLTNETHGHRWYKWGRGIAWSFFSVRRSIRRPDEGCISLTVSFPSMPFMQLFELTLTSSTNLFSSLSFLLSIAFLSFSSFVALFPFFVHVWPACENGYRARCNLSSRPISPILAFFIIFLVTRFIVLILFGCYRHGNGGHVPRFNCGTCFSEFINNSPSIETSNVGKRHVVFPLTVSSSIYLFPFYFVKRRSPKEYKYRRSLVIISIGSRRK